MCEESEPFIVRPIEYVIVRKGKPTFDEETIVIKLVDDAAGEFIVIGGHWDEKDQEVAFDFSMWPRIKALVDKLIKESTANGPTEN
jgi:hypothetical protein